jgi:hypothetical protein
VRGGGVMSLDSDSRRLITSDKQTDRYLSVCLCDSLQMTINIMMSVSTVRYTHTYALSSVHPAHQQGDIYKTRWTTLTCGKIGNPEYKAWTKANTNKLKNIFLWKNQSICTLGLRVIFMHTFNNSENLFGLGEHQHFDFFYY